MSFQMTIYRRSVQVEVAFREQTAGHNALLLLVALSHELLEARLRNAFLDVHARAAEVRPPVAKCATSHPFHSIDLPHRADDEL